MTLPTLPPPPDVPEHVPGTDAGVDAMYAIAEALTYPVDSRGRRYDVRFLLPVIAFHLARVGCVIDPDRAQIKMRRLPPTAGVVEDAVDWVPIDAPDTVEDELQGVTLDDLPKLSAAAQAEFRRRAMGEPPTPVADADLDARTPWHVQTSIQFDD